MVVLEWVQGESASTLVSSSECVCVCVCVCAMSIYRDQNESIVIVKWDKDGFRMGPGKIHQYSLIQL